MICLNDFKITLLANITTKAQAQECVLEKSIIEKRKTSINAKISIQVVEYYRLALVNIEKPEAQNTVESKKIKVTLVF